MLEVRVVDKKVKNVRKNTKFIIYNNIEIIEKTNKFAELPKRDITEEALASVLSDRDTIYILRGMRRTGKTTALYQMANYLAKEGFTVGYVSVRYMLEKKIHYSELEDLVTELFGNYDYLFIDEYSYLEDGLENLRNLYDSMKGVKLVITGSDSLTLTEPLLCKENIFRVSYSNLSRVSYKELNRLLGVTSLDDNRVYYGTLVGVSENDNESVSKNWLNLSIISNIANSIRKSEILQSKYKDINRVLSKSKDNSFLEACVYDVLVSIALDRNISYKNSFNYLKNISQVEKDVVKSILGVDNIDNYFRNKYRQELRNEVIEVLCKLGVLEPIDLYTNSMSGGATEVKYIITLPYIYDTILNVCKFVCENASGDISVVGHYLENVIIGNVIITHPEYRVSMARYKHIPFELDMIIEKNDGKALFYEIKNTTKTGESINYVNRKELLDDFSNTICEAFVLYNGVERKVNYAEHKHILSYVNISNFLLSL